MCSPKVVALAVAAALGMVLAGAVAAAAEAAAVAVVTASPASDEAVRYLSTQIDLPTVRRSSNNARHLEQLAVEARQGWPEDLVVVVDAERAKVSVIRPSDGTIGSRTLRADAASAPYAVALAAVELLEIVRNAASTQLPRTRPPPPKPILVNLAFDFGLVQRGGVGLLEPAAGADVELSYRSSPVWWAAGVHGSGFASSSRELTLLLPSTEARGTLDYRRDELSLRLGVGHRQGPSAVFGWTDVGLAFIRLHMQDDGRIFSATDRRTAIWLGLGAELRYTVVGSFALSAGAGVAFLPVASHYYGSPLGSPVEVTALQEDPFELRAHASVIWEFSL